MNRRQFLKYLGIAGGVVYFYEKISTWRTLLAQPITDTAAVSAAEAKNYHRIVVLGDPHLPVRMKEHPSLATQELIQAAKDNVINDINGWEDVDQISVVGDIVAQVANDEEYNYCKKYFEQCKKPVCFITGNHDYIYNNELSPEMHLVIAATDKRQEKLERFKRTWGLAEVFYAQQCGRYLLIYLSVDSLDSSNLAEMSKRELAWLQETLTANPNAPTIIFFHAPLNGTLSNASSRVANTRKFIAQPEIELRNIINNNKQILLWVSGHTHTPATDPSFAAAINCYEGRVTNIHNSDMDRKTIWTNSLYLYSDKIVVRTFNHEKREWIDQLERTFIIVD